MWFANIDIQFILDPYAAITYCTSYMTKIDKSITSELHFIIKKCIANNINANTRIQKLSNVFFNAQQMVSQLDVYLVFSLPLYYLFRTLQFINISPFEECVFVLKSQVALNELEPNAINIMCSLIIDKNINHPNQYESLSLTEFGSFYNIKKNSKHCKPKIIRFVNYNKP